MKALQVFLGVFIIWGLGLISPQALAQEAGSLSDGNTAWILTSTALVLFMTIPGLALFYGGLVRSQNVLSVLMHCFVICCLASVLWLVGVYSLSFSDGGEFNTWIGGARKAFPAGGGGGTPSDIARYRYAQMFRVILDYERNN